MTIAIGSLEEKFLSSASASATSSSNGNSIKRFSYAESMNDSVLHKDSTDSSPKDESSRWSEMKSKFDRCSNTKSGAIIWLIIRLLLFLGFLYVFMCALSLMSDAFRLIAGLNLGKVFRDNPYLTNPVVDLMIGVLVTMTIHSSSTTTAIMISMAASNVVPVRNAIYVVFGAEIGTSITSTLVSIVHIADRQEFRRAFAAATIQSVYNWLSILVFFPLEVTTQFLETTAEATINYFRPEKNYTSSSQEPEMLQAIIKPLTSKIVQLDKSIINKIADNQMSESNFTTMIARDQSRGPFLFSNTTLSDGGVGGILLTCALIAVFCSLAGISKTMNSILQNQLSKVIKRYINTDLPGRFKFLTGYLFILIGAVLTGIIQSSTIFTSTLTPMVGVGLISVDRVFPLILGANIGTTFDSVLGALAQDAASIRTALTVALVQVYFNILGVLVFYPLPFMRHVVIDTGKWLGKTTCQHRWFALVYIVFLFLILPLICIGLSMAGTDYLLGVLIPIVILALFVGIVNALQTQRPQCLPQMFKTWDWLPEPLHSLEPYDKYMKKLSCKKCFCCKRCKRVNVHKVKPTKDDQEVKSVEVISMKVTPV